MAALHFAEAGLVARNCGGKRYDYRIRDCRNRVICNHNLNWLGRQDSNLRMPVPKTGRKWLAKLVSVRNGALFHKRISIAYEHSAERNRPHPMPSKRQGEAA